MMMDDVVLCSWGLSARSARQQESQSGWCPSWCLWWPCFGGFYSFFRCFSGVTYVHPAQQPFDQLQKQQQLSIYSGSRMVSIIHPLLHQFLLLIPLGRVFFLPGFFPFFPSCCLWLVSCLSSLLVAACSKRQQLHQPQGRSWPSFFFLSLPCSIPFFGRFLVSILGESAATGRCYRGSRREQDSVFKNTSCLPLLLTYTPGGRLRVRGQARLTRRSFLLTFFSSSSC